VLGIFLHVFATVIAPAADWVRAGLNTNQPVWGVRGGLVWAIPPGGFPSLGGPRGLIRLGYPTSTNGSYQLINFIAVEPIVKGKRGFSELEMSKLDQARGRRLWAVSDTNRNSSEISLIPGKLSRLSSGVERLDVIVRVEPFENEARVQLVISQRSDAPGEIQLAIHREADSARLDYCVLTATMGNKARTRLLWLADETVSSLKLFSTHKTADFTPHSIYSLDRLSRDEQGDVLVAVTTDEEDPAAVFPFPGSRQWHYEGFKVTQYWKKESGTFRDDLQCAVNARHTYWQSQQPIPGGVAYENFELHERFYEGQQFIFGITTNSPAQLGIGRRTK
jgi:hypothetical protein